MSDSHSVFKIRIRESRTRDRVAAVVIASVQYGEVAARVESIAYVGSSGGE